LGRLEAKHLLGYVVGQRFVPKVEQVTLGYCLSESGVDPRQDAAQPGGEITLMGVCARVVAAPIERVGTQRLGGGTMWVATHGVGMALGIWLKSVLPGLSTNTETEGVEIPPGESVTLNLSTRPDTWDCPECGTHEAMTNSDTFNAAWWCTVCDYSTDEEPPFVERE
jgi:rubredoxin